MAISGRCVTFFNGTWSDENTPMIRAADHAAWLGSTIFDGARAFEGTTPDLDLHCARAIRSAEILGLEPPVDAAEIEALCREGVARMGSDVPLYIRPMMWACDGTPSLIDTMPESTSFAVCIEEMPLREPGPMALTLSPYRRPPRDAAPNDAKSGSHYVNNARIFREAKSRGFNNGVSLDQEGNVAETAVTNIFIVRDGVVQTPVHNGTFLNGITRQRVIGLLRDDGITVEEVTLKPEELIECDEMFLSGNANKITPVTRYEDRELPSTKSGLRARELYWDYAHQTGGAK